MRRTPDRISKKRQKLGVKVRLWKEKVIALEHSEDQAKEAKIDFCLAEILKIEQEQRKLDRRTKSQWAWSEWKQLKNQ